MKKFIYYFALANVILIGLTACSNDNDEMELQDAIQTTSEADFDKQGSDVEKNRGNESIALIAISQGFGELVSALMYVDKELDVGMVDMFLNGNDQYTVFAPTNLAFESLYTALGVEGIEELPPQLVQNVLLYHVTSGRRGSNSVVPKNGVRKVQTLLGENFTIDSTLNIDGIGSSALIRTANISASNGIIHVIDNVLLPI